MEPPQSIIKGPRGRTAPRHFLTTNGPQSKGETNKDTFASVDEIEALNVIGKMAWNDLHTKVRIHLA